MFVTVEDTLRRVELSLHVGGALTEGEVQEVVARIEKQADVLAKDPKARFVTMVIVETDNAPDARHRRRIGEATKRVTRGAQVLVTSSTLVRMAMTAMRWFSPANPDYPQSTVATYEEGRDWLVARTGFGPEVFDVLHRELRAKAGQSAARKQA